MHHKAGGQSGRYCTRRRQHETAASCEVGVICVLQDKSTCMLGHSSVARRIQRSAHGGSQFEYLKHAACPGITLDVFLGI